MAITAILDTNILLNAKNTGEQHSIHSLQVLDAVERWFHTSDHISNLNCGIVYRILFITETKGVKRNCFPI
ncbi:hypothetical protein DYY67_2321 [Candidatus Nitrosotalea sp. TS]|nr:hypothetical protein [Candidatus Nitrosotalea sp. TS]